MATDAGTRRGARTADGGERDSRNAAGREPRPTGEISRWEWVAGGVGLVLLLALLGFLAREAMAPATPPDLVARVDSVSRVTSGWLAHVEVGNRGRRTAAEVTLEGELATPEGDTLRSETTLDYVPGRSTASAGLLFARDPRSGTLVVRAMGYREP